MTDLAKRYENYARRMREFMDARNITGEIASERIGAHVTTVYNLMRGATNLDDEWREKVARAFDVDHDILFGSQPLPLPAASEILPKKRRGRKPAANDNLPFYGLAAGSLVGAPAISTDFPEHVPCPPALRHVSEAYALVTRGESMVPRFLPGERLYVNPRQQARPGDHVIIQTANHKTDAVEVWVKRFDGASGDDYNFWQYNPPARISFKKKYVNYIHRVVPLDELFDD